MFLATSGSRPCEGSACVPTAASAAEPMRPGCRHRPDLNRDVGIGMPGTLVNTLDKLGRDDLRGRLIAAIEGRRVEIQFVFDGPPQTAWRRQLTAALVVSPAGVRPRVSPCPR